MNLDSSDSIPLWLLYENEIDAWRASQTPQVATWLTLQNFKAEKHRVVLLPDSAGGIAGAVGGLGRRNGALSLWHAAGFVERLPARRFHLAQQFAAEEATQLGLGFAYGAYRFDRYRPAKSDAASIEAPPNADLQFIALASEVVAHGARLDQHAGRATSVPRNSPPRRNGLPSAIGPSTKNGWARGCSRRIFRPFMRWAAPAAGHPGWSSCVGSRMAPAAMRALPCRA